MNSAKEDKHNILRRYEENLKHDILSKDFSESHQNRLIFNHIKGEEDGHHDDVHFHIHFLLWKSDFGFHLDEALECTCSME